MSLKKDLEVLDTVEPGKMLVPATTSGQMFFDVSRFEFAQRVAAVFSKSTMVPEQFRGNIGNCIIALNYAERTGTDPFMCMQKMYIIHGRPSVETQFAVAMLNASGKFSELEYEKTPTEKPTKCRAYATKLATGKVIYGPEVSLEMAKAEGWYSKKGSKWQTMPEMMLMYRSAAFFIRQYAPEVLLGMLTKEEVTDIDQLGSTATSVPGAESDLNVTLEVDTSSGEVVKEVVQKVVKDANPVKTYKDYRAEVEALKGDKAGIQAWYVANRESIGASLTKRQKTLLSNLVNQYHGPGLNTNIEPEDITTTEKQEPGVSLSEFKDVFGKLDTILACNEFLAYKEDDLRYNLDHVEYDEFQMFALDHKAFLKEVAEREAKGE